MTVKTPKILLIFRNITRPRKASYLLVFIFISMALCQQTYANDIPLAQQVESYDQALNEAYRQLRDEKTPAERNKLREAQRAWIDRRNEACNIKTTFKNQEDYYAAVTRTPRLAKCVLKQTKSRLAPLRAELQTAVDRRNQPTSPASYPPYPEIWYRKLNMESPSWPPLVYRTSEGDYLIVIRTKSWGKKWHKGLYPSYISNVLYFFSGRSHVALTDKELEKYWVGLPVVKTNWIVTDREGWNVGTTGLDHRAPARCPQGVNAYFFSTKKPMRGKYSPPSPPYEIRKSLLVKINPPDKIEISHLCTDTGEHTYTQYVQGKGAQFYEPLEDDTILTFIRGVGHGLILRLNHKLESKPGQLGSDMLWVPTGEMETLIETIGSTSETPYQSVQDALRKNFENVAN